MFGAYATEPEFSDGNEKLILEPVRGTRTFRVNQAGWLTGLYYTECWVPGWNEARNWKRGTVGEDAYGNWTAVFPQSGMWHPVLWLPYYGGVEWFRVPDDTVPLSKGRWGFYAYNEGSNDFKSEGPVWAVVEGAGRIVVGTRGFRASKARIIAMCFADGLDPELLAAVCTHYPDVPKYASFEAMVADLPPDHWGEK